MPRFQLVSSLARRHTCATSVGVALTIAGCLVLARPELAAAQEASRPLAPATSAVQKGAGELDLFSAPAPAPPRRWSDPGLLEIDEEEATAGDPQPVPLPPALLPGLAALALAAYLARRRTRA